MEADFSGWASRSGLKCSDGKTIMPHAFQHQNRTKVPLVWQHGHDDPENVLGHAILEDRPEGVYAYAFFNDTPKAVHARQLLEHKDITMLSIWANQLVQRAGRVVHGVIREVSLVLAGANPGAVIENVTIRHGDDVTEFDDEIIIFTGEEFQHGGTLPDDEKTVDDKKVEDKKVEDKPEVLAHAEDDTVKEIFETLNDEQKNVVYYMVGQALEQSATNADDDAAEHGATDKEDKEGKKMANVFEQGDKTKSGPVLSHDDMKSIFKDAEKTGSLKAAVEAYLESESGLQHGITDIESLFPEAKALTAAPEFFKRRTEWVSVVLNGVRKTPFSRIKTHWADLTYEDARAKGYVKGNLKKEEWFGTARRVTTPTTVYKKQKLDRDDIIDITEFDVVVWMKGEMRLMLEEELARAILIGDGRDISDEDKISEENIRPIATDHELFTVRVYVNLDDSNSNMSEVVDALTLNRQFYRGSGLPTMFTTETFLARFLLQRDTLGRRLYDSVDQLATELRVSSIVTVEVMEEEPDMVAVLVNLNDYSLGADKGGQTTMFDDFDIDYNQYKYLIETRCSGALTRLKSAMVVLKTGASAVLITPTVPTFVEATGVVTIPTQTGVVYKNDVTNATLSAGAQSALAEGATLRVRAEPASASYYFATSEDDTWSFTRPAA